MTSYSRLDEETRTSVENAVARLIKPLDGDTDVQALQARMNSRYGMNVQTDRSAYSWNGEGKHPKYVLLHLIAQKFIADHSITLHSEFDSLFGKQISAALGGGVAGKSPSAQRLLDQIAREGRYAPRDQKLVEQFGAISFDGVDYRAGWGLGFSSVQDIGRVVQKPVIEHFRKMPGYAIEQA